MQLNNDHHSCRLVDTMVWYPGGARLITDQQVILLRQKGTPSVWPDVSGIHVPYRTGPIRRIRSPSGGHSPRLSQLLVIT